MKLSSGPLAAALLSTGSHALFGNREPPKPQPHIIDSFTWADPFITPEITSYDAECEHTAVLPAREYTLNELQVPSPKGLREWAPGLKTFFSGREYPGSWGGLDRHLHDRTILSMEYKDLPLEVRLWIEEQERSDGEGKGLFGVFVKPTEVDEEGELVPITEVVSFPKPEEVDRSQDEHKVAIFAPGAIYHALPLFAAESSTCKGQSSSRARFVSPCAVSGRVFVAVADSLFST